ncbi:MAG: hypothetical protein HRT87_03445 [Legionellales bacterium]|nr:hypothetical protein [Legionellales bacterium]
MGHSNKIVNLLDLQSIKIPDSGKNSNIISYLDLDRISKQLFAKYNIELLSSEYKLSNKGKNATAIYSIKVNQKQDKQIADDELAMFFTWTSSYNKSTSFNCSIGGIVKEDNSYIILPSNTNYARKNKTNFRNEIVSFMDTHIKTAITKFNYTILEKNKMKTYSCFRDDQIRLSSLLFFAENLLTVTQVNKLKKVLKVTSLDNKTCWDYYKVVLNILKDNPSRTWSKTLIYFHVFITSELKSSAVVTYRDYDVLEEIELEDIPQIDMSNIKVDFGCL